jgi:hypothetical protein
MDQFQFTVEDAIVKVRNRCLSAIEALGWQVRHDLTQDYRITCYVPIADILPQAPVYTISLYPEDRVTHLVLVAANDALSQSHAQSDLPKLKAAIITGRVAPSPVETEPASSAGSRSRPKCFISYRRYDSADVVGRIYDRLVAAYGADQIFKDVDNIPIGEDFRKILNEAVTSCAVLLVVIGRDWLTVTGEQGQRRLDDPGDFVRIEIEAALSNDIPVVPLLVREASMPREEDLSGSLRELVYRNGLQIRADPDFHRDMDRLIQALDRLLEPQ